MIQQIGNMGVYSFSDATFTFQLGNTLTGGTLDLDKVKVPQNLIPFVSIGKYKILPYGRYNLEPQEVEEMLGSNRLLPELIEKQIKIMVGKGPTLYRKEIKDGKNKRVAVSVPRVESWLDSWESRGMKDDVFKYLTKVVRDYYYMESYFSKWKPTQGYHVGYGGSLPVAGLEHINIGKGRLATTKEIDVYSSQGEDEDFNHVVVGDWTTVHKQKMKAYNRFRYRKEQLKNSSISYVCNGSFGKEVYGYNSFYRGIKQWIVGSNLTPKYINSFLENSLSAKLHVIIPDKWLELMRDEIGRMCQSNAELKEQEKDLCQFRGIDIGTQYHEGLLQKLVYAELRRLTATLSGKGANQGKLFVSYSASDGDKQIEWKIEEIPLKYKEYITALSDYDKRADEVLLSAKGIDASISNISKDGVISKSGSDAYYNYLIYISMLTMPEYFCLKDLNEAVRINFPDEYTKGVRIGFEHHIPEKQEETTPSQRLQNNQQ